jgi:hypothetical protein
MRFIVCLCCLCLLLSSCFNCVSSYGVSGGELIWFQNRASGVSSYFPYSITVDASGLYVVGCDDALKRWVIEKRTLTSGSLIWTQTENVTVPPDLISTAARDVAVDSSGIYVVGEDGDSWRQYVNGSYYQGGVNNSEWRIEKRSLTDGSLLWNRTSNAGGTSLMSGVAVDGSGVYVAGMADIRLFWGQVWAIEKRSLTDGSLIWTSVSNSSQFRGSANDIAVDGSAVYVVGWFFGENDEGGIQKRNLTDGSVIWTQNIQTRGSDISAVTVDVSGIYLVGEKYVSARARPCIIEKRSLTDGSLLWNRTSVDTYYLPDIAVDSTGAYIVSTTVSGTRTSGLSFGGRIEKRSLTDGSIIWINSSSGTTSYLGVAVDSSGLYLAGGEATGVRFEKRELTSTPSPPPSDFNISSSPESRTVNNGSSTTYTITASSLNGFSSPVSLSVPSWPAGLSGTFNPTSITPVAGGSIQSTLAVNVASTVGAGSYPITIVGTSSNQTHSIMTTLTVIVATPSPPPTSPPPTTPTPTTPQSTTPPLTTPSPSYTPSPAPTPQPRTGCLIATALYGSSLQPEVQFLRHFRDETLVKVAGQTFRNNLNDWYYSFSPQVSEFIRQNHWMRPPMILLISPIVSFLHAVDAIIQLITH